VLILNNILQYLTFIITRILFSICMCFNIFLSMLTFFYRRGNILKVVNIVETASKTNKEALFLFWPQLCMCTRVHSAYT